jgi:predicted dehydrogenase
MVIMALRAVVIGAGWAAEGYIIALGSLGVDVVALCGRSLEPTRALAGRYRIKDVRDDWRNAILSLRPDIVCVATPASPHVDMVLAAVDAGCHVICEKPLALTADGAHRMLDAVEQAGVRHAYGATSRYSPPVVHAQTLLSEGLIGKLMAIEVVEHFALSPLHPYSWFHRREEGGGVLFNAFTHILVQLAYLTGGAVRGATGRVHGGGRAPVSSSWHDFRDWIAAQPVLDHDGEWRKVDADMIGTVLLELEQDDGNRVEAMFRGSAFGAARNPDGLALYGSEGTLQLVGVIWYESIWHQRRGQADWNKIDIPGAASSPADGDPVQFGWDRLGADFVADILEQDHQSYPTFVDGHLANLIIDQIREAVLPTLGDRAPLVL